MPVFTGDPFRIGVGMYWQYFRVPFRPRRVRMNVQFTKMPPEGLVLFKAQLLVTEEQNLMFGQRGMEFFDLMVAQRGGQIDARDFCAYARRDRVNLQCGIAHGIVLFKSPMSGPMMRSIGTRAGRRCYTASSDVMSCERPVYEARCFPVSGHPLE